MYFSAKKIANSIATPDRNWLHKKIVMDHVFGQFFPWISYPYHPCMVYLPLFTYIYHKKQLFPSMVCVTLQKPFQTSLRFSNTPSLFKTIFPIQILFLCHINITKKTPHVYSTKKHPPRNSTNDLPQKTLPNNPQSGNKNQSMGGVVHPPLHPLPPHCPISSPAMDQTWVPWWG